MASRSEKYPISLVLKAVDQATGPLRAFTKRLNAMTAPVRLLSKTFSDFGRATGIGKLSDAFGGVRQSVGAVGHETMALAGRLVGLTAAAGFAVAAFGAKAIQAGDDMATLADRLGLSVDEFVQLRFAAEQGDVTVAGFANGMDILNRSLGELKSGSGPLRSFLSRVSPGFLSQMKAAKGNAEAIELLAGAFEQIQDPTKRAALAQAAFGRGGKEMIGFLALGRQGIAAYRAKQIELQGSQEAFARGAAELDNVLRETRYAFTGVGNSIFAEFSPALLELARASNSFLGAHRGELAKWARETAAAFGAWVQGGGLKRLTSGLRDFAARALAVIDKLGGWKSVLVGIAAVMAGPLIGALGGLVTSVVALAGALAGTPIGWVLLGLGAIGGALALVSKNLDGLRDLFGPVFEPLLPLLRDLGARLSEFWRLAGPVLLPALKALGYVLGGVVYLALTAIVSVLRIAVPLVTALVGGINNALGDARMLFTEGPGAWAMREWGEFRGERPALDVRNRPTLDTAAAAPPMYQSTEAHVTVDFSNLPHGARVQADPQSTTPIDIGMGYSMVTP